MEIIRNCSHLSSVYLALILDAHIKPEKVMKCSFEKEGIKDILNEYKGYCWYAQQLDLDQNEVVNLYQYNHSFAILKIKFQQGELGNPYLSIEKNYNRLFSALTYYFKIFKNTEYSYSHGDYSLSNLIFLNEKVDWIIDWEHFNDLLPPEFDILNCIMETCYFTFIKTGKISNNEVNQIKSLLQYTTNNMPLSEAAVNTPAECLSSYYNANKQIFGSQYNKYPLAICSEDTINKIDEFFKF